MGKGKKSNNGNEITMNGDDSNHNTKIVDSNNNQIMDISSTTIMQDDTLDATDLKDIDMDQSTLTTHQYEDTTTQQQEEEQEGSNILNASSISTSSAKYELSNSLLISGKVIKNKLITLTEQIFNHEYPEVSIPLVSPLGRSSSLSKGKRSSPFSSPIKDIPALSENNIHNAMMATGRQMQGKNLFSETGDYERRSSLESYHTAQSDIKEYTAPSSPITVDANNNKDDSDDDNVTAFDEEQQIIEHIQGDDQQQQGEIEIEGGEEEEEEEPYFSWRLFWAYTGPGWMMCVSYIDPGNVEADLQGGAYSNFQLLWILGISTSIGLIFQILAARLGVVTGQDLAKNCKMIYSKNDAYVLWGMTQIAIIGSDIQEIIGSAIALRVLFSIPLWIGCLITGLDTFLWLGLHVCGIRKLEALFAVLISTMVVCFLVTFALTNPSASTIASGFLQPKLRQHTVMQSVALLGAVVMPHNLFLHSNLVLSRDVDRSNRNKIRQANKYFAIESGLALFVTLIINMAIISVFAHGFYSDTCADVSSPLAIRDYSTDGPISAVLLDPPFACLPVRSDHGNNNNKHSATVSSDLTCTTASGTETGYCGPIGLQEAASSLEMILGPSSAIVWAIGLLACGQSSTMTGTLAGQTVMLGFLDLHIPNFLRVMVTRLISLVPATLVAVYANSSSTEADTLDEWLNVIQSLQLPFALVPLIFISGSEEIMGEFRIGKSKLLVLWTITGMIIMTNWLLVSSYLHIFESTGKMMIVFAFGVAYFYFLYRMARGGSAGELKYARIETTSHKKYGTV